MTGIAFWNSNHVSNNLSGKKEKKIAFQHQRWEADCTLKGTGGLSMEGSSCFAAGKGIISARNFWENVTAFQHFFSKVKGSARNSSTVNDNSWTHRITCYLCQAGQFDFTLNGKNPWHRTGVSCQRLYVSLTEKQQENSLPLGDSLFLSPLLQTEKGGNGIMEWVHSSQFILAHWKASTHACCCKTELQDSRFQIQDDWLLSQCIFQYSENHVICSHLWIRSWTSPSTRITPVILQVLWNGGQP